MVDFFRRLKPKKDEEQETPAPVFPTAQPPARSSPAAETLPEMSDRSEPDYRDVAELLSSPGAAPQPLAPILLVGVGPLGQAVLENLSRWIELDPDGNRAVPFLLVTVMDETALDYELPASQSQLLADGEKLELTPERSATNNAWYNPVSSEPVRPDGRAAVFQNLKQNPSPLWDTLQRLLQDKPRDVWLIGAAFGAASGLILDLSHLIRMISAEQSQHPFIGWMMALPTISWAGTHQTEAAAFLREAERLLRPRASRDYEAYAPSSDNPSLHTHTARLSDDAQAILLSEPDPEMFGSPAAQALVSKMALTLLTFLQRRLWDTPDEFCFKKVLLRRPKRPPLADDLMVSAFGLCAHTLPMEPLKNWVRSRLAGDLLFNRTWGLVRGWAENELDEDEETGRNILRGSGHPLLIMIADIRSRFDLPEVWPTSEYADLFLAEKLRQEFHDLLKPERLENGLTACASLIASIELVITSVELPEEVYDPLEAVLEKARTQIQGWLPWLRQVKNQAQDKLSAADEAWQAVSDSPYEHTILEENFPETIYQKLAVSTDLQQGLREFVRLAWLRNGPNLELNLNLLPPGWKAAAKGAKRIKPDPAAFAQLWELVYRIVVAHTQTPAFWPVGLSMEGGLLPEPAQVQKAAGLTLQYDKGQMPQNLSPTHPVYMISGDAAWRGRNWFPPTETIHRFDAFPANMGVILNLYHPIPLNTVAQFTARFQKAYLETTGRSAPGDIHIYLAEQRACEFERLAINALPFKERGLVRPWLSHNSVDILENATAVEAFVHAWLSGLVEPAFGSAAYSLKPSSAGTPVWTSRPCEHPLDAAQEFARLESGLNKAILKTLPDKITPNEERLAQITDGWNYGKRRRLVEWSLTESDDIQEYEQNCKNYDWYILVTGQLRRKQA